MKRRTILLLLTFIFLLTAPNALFARPVTIKVGSLVPKGSPWDKALRQIAAEWSEVSDGKIIMKIYPGGIAGDEADMIRKMRFNQLQGGVFTSLGLNDLAPDTVALSVPFLITNNAEYEYVFKRIAPVLSEGIKKAGFQVVSWTQAGWIHFFSKKKIEYPDDLRKLKIAGSDIDPAMFQAWKTIGYTVLPISMSEVGTALSSGMVDACYNVPLGATAYQLYNVVDYMMDFPISPVLGGFVMTERAWNRIDDDLKPELLKRASEVADDLYENLQDLEREAIRVLKNQDVEIVSVSEDARQQWRKEFERGFEMVVGKSFSERIYDLITEYLEEFRN
jgi:TRAP-type transport system periplasmic protein